MTFREDILDKKLLEDRKLDKTHFRKHKTSENTFLESRLDTCEGCTGEENRLILVMRI